MRPRSMTLFLVWRHKRTGTVHRDPHCTRVEMSKGDARVAGRESPFEEERVRGGAAFALGRHCGFCYSRAGYARGGDVVA